MARGSYPHPVLDGSDDVLADFTLKNAKVRPFAEHVDIDFTLELTEPTLLALLETGDARLSARVHCSSTFLIREVELEPVLGNHNRGQYHFSIPQDDVSGEVSVAVKILCGRPELEYQPSKQNPQYGDAAFRVFLGDVLADAGSFTFEPGKAYDPMQPPIESSFVFMSDPQLKKGIQVDLGETEHVIVKFPEDTFKYFQSQQTLPELQVALVVLPALVQVLSQMQRAREDLAGEGDDFSDRQWFRAIENVLERSGALDDDALTQAQMILDGRPIHIALQKLDQESEEF